MTGIPAFLSSAVTVLLPQAMPPVSPTTSILQLLNAAAPERHNAVAARRATTVFSHVIARFKGLST